MAGKAKKVVVRMQIRTEGPSNYRVEKLVNRIKPEVGSVLTAEQVKDVMLYQTDTTVEVLATR